MQLEEALKTVIAVDFPTHWPDLVPALAASFNGGDQAMMSGALRCLRIVVRKYEFRDDSERVPLLAIVDTTFPPVLAVFQSLIANPSPSPDLAELLKLCCKIFWSSCYLEMPALVLRDDQFSGWMSAFLGLAARAVPEEGAPEDPELRKQWPWWKAKKWVYHVAYRLFSRYGDPRRCSAQCDVAFATRWKAECSLPFLSAVLNELSAVARGVWVAPRVSNILLQYVSESINHADTWKTLKPHIQDIVQHAVVPLLSFDEEDAELWRDDPQEYVRKGYDVIEDIYSSKTAAMGVIDSLCKSRKKSQLDPVMTHIVRVVGECGGAGGDAGAGAAARRLDGALLAVGTLCDRLKKEPKYRGQLEPMLQAHVLPLFASPHGHLRAKGCWLAGLYADSPFAAGQGQGPTFTALLQCVIGALSDPELPVRVDAGVAVRSFVDAVEAEDLGPLRPLVPDLLQRFLAISQEVDSEDLTSSLETVVDRFGSDMGPYAVSVVSALTQQFARAIAEEDAAVAEEGGDFGSGGGGALAGYSILRAISTVLDSVCSIPQLYPQLEELLFPILHRYTSEEGLDVFEEITQIATYLTYFAPGITPRMWTLYPRLLECLDTWAIDYWKDVLLPLDNYISRGTEAFLTAGSASTILLSAPADQQQQQQQQQVSLLDLTNRTIHKALSIPPRTGDENAATTTTTTTTTANSFLDEAGTDAVNESVLCAAQLISVILQNCMGRVDHCVPPYLSLIMERLHAIEAAREKPDREVIDALLVAGTDALYYNPALTLQTLAASGALPFFMTALSRAIEDKRKNGKSRHFPAMRDKKVVTLGLTAVLGVPTPSLPPGVAETRGQVATTVVHMLLALKAQEEAKAGRVEDRADGTTSTSSSDDGLGRFVGGSGHESDDDEDDDGDVDEAVAKRMMAAAARRAGHGEAEDEGVWGSEDDDDDDAYWSEDDEEDIGSPLDAVSPYLFFAQTLQTVQGSDPSAFAAITSRMDAGVQAAVQGMMQYAAELAQVKAAAN